MHFVLIILSRASLLSILKLFVLLCKVECVFIAKMVNFLFHFKKSFLLKYKRVEPIKIEKLSTLWTGIFSWMLLAFLKNGFVLAADCLEIRNVWPISKCDWVTLQLANSITLLNSFWQKSDDHSRNTCWQCNLLNLYFYFFAIGTFARIELNQFST